MFTIYGNSGISENIQQQTPRRPNKAQRSTNQCNDIEYKFNKSDFVTVAFEKPVVP